MAEPSLALPSAEGERPRNLLPMGLLLMAGSGIMLFGTLIGVYLHLRRVTGRWPPEGVRIDDYIGNVLVFTMIMGGTTVEWAHHSLRRGQRKQAAGALGLTIGLGLAFLNLLAYTAGQATFDASSHPYGLVVVAMTVLLGIAVAVGIGYVTLTLLRVTGGQVTAAEPDQLRATAWYWHFTVAVSLAIWYTVTVMQ